MLTTYLLYNRFRLSAHCANEPQRQTNVYNGWYYGRWQSAAAASLGACYLGTGEFVWNQRW